MQARRARQTRQAGQAGRVDGGTIRKRKQDMWGKPSKVGRANMPHDKARDRQTGSGRHGEPSRAGRRTWRAGSLRASSATKNNSSARNQGEQRWRDRLAAKTTSSTAKHNLIL